MKIRGLLLLFVLVFSVVPCLAGSEEKEPADKHGQAGIGAKLLFYIPNRLLDLIDRVRVRVRVGPGLAMDLRATKAADLFIGTYGSVYAGLPGPRMRRMPVLPVGLESRTGVEVSVADATAGLGVGPGYSPTEIGAGVQLLILGADAGFDPMEIVDFVGGFFLWDPRGDDWP